MSAHVRRSRRAILILACAGVAGLLMMIAAQRFAMPVLIGPGLLLFGAGAAAAGLDTVLRRYSHERHTESGASVVFVGPAAVLLGLTTILVGCAFGVAGIVWTLGSHEQLFAYLLRRPGSALLAAGLMIGMSGAAAVIGAREWRGSAGRFLARLPERIGGAMILIFGIALCAAGAFELVTPDGFDRALDGLLAPLRDAAAAGREADRLR